MSFIVPKKPQILYAPMLSSFGGGSARGFNPGGGGGGADPFYDGSTSFTFINNSGESTTYKNSTLSVLNSMSAYSSAGFYNDTSKFDVVGGFQKLVLGGSGSYDLRFTVDGAKSVNITNGKLNGDTNTLFAEAGGAGGTLYSGRGARQVLTRTVSAGDTLYFLCGRPGQITSDSQGTGGAGASGIWLNNDWRVISGGGGSAGSSSNGYGRNGDADHTSSDGRDGMTSSSSNVLYSGVNGGTSGNGGGNGDSPTTTASMCANSGGGINSAGADNNCGRTNATGGGRLLGPTATPAQGTLWGGTGEGSAGQNYGAAGFGGFGGGGGGSNNNGYGSGGGGYSGGGGGYYYGGQCGGAGGSYVDTSFFTKTSGTTVGNQSGPYEGRILVEVI
jgi:hypothetical protein